MAIRTLLWAKDQTVTTQTVRNGVVKPASTNALDKLVLIAIGDEASETTWDSLIGVEDIAVFAGCTRRAARESLGRLERAGFIRCRETRVESGRHGWKRIFLLADDSPLVQGLVEVDFGSVEEISRFQMRTFRDRNKAGFVPSDARRLTQRKPKDTQETAGQSEGEQGSSREEGRGNEVPPPRGNEVPPEGERGSSSEGERGSSPSCSTTSSSPSEGSEGGIAARPEEHLPEAEDWAHQLIVKLEFGRHPRPNLMQADHLARLVQAAHTEHGLSQREIHQHCRATLNQARTSGVAYLRGGLLADKLPLPKAPRRVNGPAASSRPDGPATADPALREALRAGWRDLSANAAN